MGATRLPMLLLFSVSSPAAAQVSARIRTIAKNLIPLSYAVGNGEVMDLRVGAGLTGHGFAAISTRTWGRFGWRGGPARRRQQVLRRRDLARRRRMLADRRG